MSVLEQPKLRGPYTWADVAALPEDGVRREIIGGQLIGSPSPLTRHQVVTTALVQILDWAGGSDAHAVPAPLDYRYDDENYVQPDVVVLRAADVDLDEVVRASVTPLLLVEILSPSNPAYDRLLKRDLYERLGVPSYWIVDPGAADREPAITALRLVDGAYEVDAEVAGAERFATDVPFPVTFAPADLLP